MGMEVNKQKSESMPASQLKPLIVLLQDIAGPIFTCIAFLFTFVLDYMNKIDSVWLKIPVALLVLSMAGFYIARFRKIWAEGTSLKKQNKKDGQKTDFP